MDKEKYPDLARAYDDLVKERDAVLEKIKPLDLQAAKLWTEAEKHHAAWRKVREQIAQIEADGNLREITMKIAALARAMGARSLKAGP
jgi:hypothetical protein